MVDYYNFMGNTTFTPTPLFGALTDFSIAITPLLYFLVLTLSCVIIISQKKYILLSFIGIWIVFIFFEFNALQPYFYQYLLFAGALIFFNSDKERRFVLKIIFASIYLWAGVHKLSPFYFYEICPELIRNSNFQLEAVLLEFMSFSAPFIEIGIGLLILINKWHKLTRIIILCFHIGVVYTIVFVFKFNYIIVPWNIAMIAFGILLVRPITMSSKFSLKSGIFILLFSVLLPAVNLIKPQLSYFSWNVYSGTVPSASLYFHKSYQYDVPESMQECILIQDDWCTVNLVTYSIYEGEIAITPEIFNFQRIAKSYCRYFPPGSEYAVQIITYSNFTRKEEWYDWNQLQKF